MIALDLTWIVHHLQVFRISCATTQEKLGSYRPLFRRTARSFQPLDADERDDFQDTRLRIATVRASKTLAQLSRRTGNAWSLEETAVMNAVFEFDRLEASQRVKIAAAQAYRPRRGEHRQDR